MTEPNDDEQQRPPEPGDDLVASVFGDAGGPDTSKTGGGGGLGRGLIIGGLIVVVVLVVWAALTALQHQGSGIVSDETQVEGTPAPDFTLPLLFAGTDMSLADLKGKPAVMNFWASWCGPCKDEAPILADAYRRWKGSGIQFLGVDVSDSTKWGQEFENHYGIGYDSAFDATGATGRSYGITGYPETFLIDAKGIIVGKWVGPFQTPEQIDGFLSRLAPGFEPKTPGKIVVPPEDPEIPEQPNADLPGAVSESPAP